MSIQSLIEFEPVRSLSAVLTLGAAVIVALAYNQNWSGEAVALISGVWSSVIAVVGTFFVREKVTPNVTVDQKVHDTIVALSELLPEDPEED